MMAKKIALLQIFMIAGILVGAARASDDVVTATPTTARQGLLAATDTAENDAGSNDSGSQPPPVLDRRDRIFYPGDTERPKPLLRKLFLNIVFDQEEIFTSPFRANRHNALEWLLPTAAMGGLIAADTHIANAFENSRGRIPVQRQEFIQGSLIDECQRVPLHEKPSQVRVPTFANP